MLVQLLIFLIARTFGIMQIPPPEFQFRAQTVEVEIGKQAVRAVEIVHSTLQNRARTHTVAFGLVMKSYRQLNQTLDMQAEMPARGPVAGQRSPDVLENFMSVEELLGIEQIEEQIEPSVEVCMAGRHGHRHPPIALLCLTIYMFP